LKILCIDDNQDIVGLLDAVLSSKGFNFVSCNKGKDGLKLIKTGNFDVILLDLAMPNFSGHDVINELKKETSLGNYNIVLFTAHAISNAEIEAFHKEGIKDFIRKPVRIDDLLTVLTNFEK